MLTNGADDSDSIGDDLLPSQSSSSEPTPSETPSPTPSDTLEPINLDPDAYLGRDVDEVIDDLRQLGLRVDTQPIDNPGDKQTDTVASISPTTGLTAGDTVIVEYYAAPEPSPEPTPSESTPSEPTPSPPTGSASASAASTTPDPTDTTSPEAAP